MELELKTGWLHYWGNLLKYHKFKEKSFFQRLKDFKRILKKFHHSVEKLSKLFRVSNLKPQMWLKVFSPLEIFWISTTIFVKEKKLYMLKKLIENYGKNQLYQLKLKFIIFNEKLRLFLIWISLKLSTVTRRLFD